MIVVCEPQCSGFEHAEVNAALLAVLKQAFPGQRTLFLAERDHIARVGEALRRHAVEGIEFQPICLPRQRGYVIRFVRELGLCKRVFALAARNGARWIIYSSITSQSLVSIKLLIKSFPQLRCGVAMHAVLATITKRPLRPLRWLFWFRRALEFAHSDRLRYIVMGQPIADELRRRLPSIGDRLISIDLPYLYADPQPHEPFRDNVVRFGAFGVGHRDKGTDILFRLAADLQRVDACCRSQFTLLGPIVDWRLRKLTPDPVLVPSPSQPLSRADLDCRAKSVDYAVFCHKPQSYALRASAVFFDALSYLKPVIAYRAPFFEHYFRVMGDIGYLCDTYDEMRQTIVEIMRSRPAERYARQRANLLAGRGPLSPSRLGARLAELLR